MARPASELHQLHGWNSRVRLKSCFSIRTCSGLTLALGEEGSEFPPFLAAAPPWIKTRFLKQQVVSRQLEELTREDKGQPQSPGHPDEGAQEKLRRPGCSPWEGPQDRLSGMVWEFLLNAVPACPALAVPLGDQPEVSPEQSLEPGLLCHPKSSASRHWSSMWDGGVRPCISDKPGRPWVFLQWSREVPGMWV